MEVKMFIKKLIVFSLLTILLIVTFSINVFCQNESQRPLFNLRECHLSVSGFLGSIRHSDILRENHFAYGGGMLFKFSNNFGLQLEMNHSKEDNSSQEINDGINNTTVYHDYIDQFKCYSYILTANFFLSTRNNMKLKPYFKIGLSENDYSTYREYIRKQIDNLTGETIDYFYEIMIPKSLDKHRYREGLVLASGIYLSPFSVIDLYVEMLYNSINSDSYEGGVFLHGGIRLKVF
jgi:hypothetical protein